MDLDTARALAVTVAQIDALTLGITQTKSAISANAILYRIQTSGQQIDVTQAGLSADQSSMILNDLINNLQAMLDDANNTLAKAS